MSERVRQTGLPKAVVSWSSGKDSAMALYRILQTREVDVVTLLTTITERYQRISMHGVREELLDMQAKSIGLPLEKVVIPYPCSNEIYEERMADTLSKLKRQGVTHAVFGDLFLEDIKKYREEKLAGVGIQPVFPLWLEDTKKLAVEMLAAGFRAVITCVDPKKLDVAFAGREFDESFLVDLPSDVDPCGENGEFHTFVYDGPVFRQPIRVIVGERVLRDGFEFADVLPVRP